ncbi:hypothetical protein C8J55DRAFT_38155 [Lentinula edodes]|uniref:Uncharacterized protein n=1 Tax=Lentinula lateritia TaxID=40482 RepID=A0A9W9AJC8_9AGAR|nr:hypothetical protein C8J55DRAFT_38155 [Lentinula edodes]
MNSPTGNSRRPEPDRGAPMVTASAFTDIHNCASCGDQSGRRLLLGATPAPLIFSTNSQVSVSSLLPLYFHTSHPRLRSNFRTRTMKFTSTILAGSYLLLGPVAILAQDSSTSTDTAAAESSALSAASSVVSADAGSVTVIDGFTITIPSGISIPSIPSAVLSDTSLIASIASSITATLTGSLASEASSILNEITGGSASSTSTGTSATTTGSGSSVASASSTSASNGAMSLEGGVIGLIGSVGAGLLAGMWIL